jgi:histidyl-tRNA synthetase
MRQVTTLNMSNKVQPARGTQDLLPETASLFRHIDDLAFRTAELYGYGEIKTPIFEFSEVFHRSLGDTSDAVSKETYDFNDRGGDSLTLRPEGTAGVVRALISNGLAQNLPLKFYYCGPMFRYERPQKGRYRQFHQLGVEALGFDNPLSDVESILLGSQILNKLGLAGKFSIQLNTLGDKESRDRHREALVQFLTPFANELSPDSQVRLAKNPLRILDSKNESDQKIVASAPQMTNFLNDNSKTFFHKVCETLTANNIAFELNANLVRGLDYYTHTVFEFTTDLLGAQSTLLAGGRYDGLVAQMGGPATAGVGWAAGIERLALLINGSAFSAGKKIAAVICADESTENYCLGIASRVRDHNIQVELINSGNMGKRFKRADKIGAQYAIVIGSIELQNKMLTLKNLKTGTQTSVPESDLITAMDFNISS